MSGDDVIDYRRYRVVNRVSLVVMIAVIGLLIVGIYNTPLADIVTMSVFYVVAPVAVTGLAALLGAASKRGIDYRKGKWVSRKVWMTFEEYESMLKTYDSAYSHLYSSPASSITCAFLLLVAAGVGSLIPPYLTHANPPVLGSLSVDAVVFAAVIYSVFASAGYLIGFRIPSIDKHRFFRTPVKGSAYDFARELSFVRGIRAGMSVEIGERNKVRAILSADCRCLLEGLPDTVSIKVQVSEKSIVYPYLVGTIADTKKTEERKETVTTRMRFPALFEYSMDGDVAIIVARYDIPKRTRSIPTITTGSFRTLARELVKRLRIAYDEAQ